MLATVRYIVDDVSSAMSFYTTHLGFEVQHDARPAFAAVTREGLRLLLSGAGSSGAQAMPDGRRPTAGGWNRIQLTVPDLRLEVERLKASGLHFRNEIVTGVAGMQIVLDDVAGNPIELFQPAAR